MKDVWSTTQAAQLHSTPVKQPKKVPAWASFVALTIVVVTATVVVLNTYDHYAGLRKATAEMLQAITQAQVLEEAVEELFVEPGSGDIRAGLSKNDIKTLQALLDKIQREPQEAYASAVEDKLDISGHQKLLEELALRLENAQEQLAISKMKSAVEEAQALSEEIDALYIDVGSDFISSGWTVDKITALQSRLSDIQREPEERYYQAVAEHMSITNHQQHLAEMEQRLAEAGEKRAAADETNALFTTEVVKSTMDSTTELPLSPDTDDADIQLLLDIYGEKERSDAFWNTVVYVLERAAHEIAQSEALTGEAEVDLNNE